MMAHPRPGFRFRQSPTGPEGHSWAVFDQDRLLLGRIWPDAGRWTAEVECVVDYKVLKLLGSAVEAACWLKSHRWGLTRT